jgi:glutathione peroxidase
MTLRQRIAKLLYPLIMRSTGKRAQIGANANPVAPPVPFYSLRAIANDGKETDFAQFKGKKLLLVNTASDCGFTGQYDDLEKLYGRYKDRLIVLGFPANDFKQQEKGSDEEIAAFCKLNFGVTFPLFSKSSVVKGPGQNPVFQWLTDKNRNGWNEQAPTWNFCKYLIDEQGRLTHFFASAVSPLQEEVLRSIVAS